MPNRKHLYYEGDDITFRGTFKIDGVPQTPDDGSALVKVMRYGSSTPVINEIQAEISGSQVRYKYSNLIEGQFMLFLTASFYSGADQRTGVIEFIVRAKEAH